MIRSWSGRRSICWHLQPVSIAVEGWESSNKKLQAEWNELGSQSFVFEILDELTPGNDPAQDYRTDLAFLEALWLEKLEPYGDRGYNEKEKRERREVETDADPEISGERQAE